MVFAYFWVRHERRCLEFDSNAEALDFLVQGQEYEELAPERIDSGPEDDTALEGDDLAFVLRIRERGSLRLS